MSPKSNQPYSRRKPTLPKKPYAGFPLAYHASGKFQKRIDGKLQYFGRWGKRAKGEVIPFDDLGWEAALAEYDEWRR